MSAAPGAVGRGELEAALEAMERGEEDLSPVFRESDPGNIELIAEGYERQVLMSAVGAI